MGTSRVAVPARGYIGRFGVVKLAHSMVIGATGAITSQDSASGIIATRNSAGNYTYALRPLGQAFKRVIEKNAELEPNPAVVPIAASGQAYCWFSDTLINPATNSVILQWYNLSSAAADITSGGKVYVTFELETGV